MEQTRKQKIALYGTLVAVFLGMTLALTKVTQEVAVTLNEEYAHFWLFPVALAMLLAGLTVLFLWQLAQDAKQPKKEHGPLYFPLFAAGLGLVGMVIIYLFIGMWPTGAKTGMIVDMHHQYAPLLAQLREMILDGDSFLYSFEVGLGTGFLPLFAYYLACPLNLLLVLFPEHLLAEGILLLTLLKNALSAFFFALCVQYVYRRRDYTIPAVAIMYSLMMYLLAYSWNLMWLDGVMVLPLIIMNFERLMRTGKFLPYILSLAYALYCNYYIGFMLCIFLVLYYIAYVLREKRAGKQIGVSFGRFSVGSLLAGGLAMFLLLPTALSLGATSAAGDELPELVADFDLFALPAQMMAVIEPTIRSGNLPNIYCGLLAVFLVPIYATTKTIPLRRRLTMLGLLGLLAFSFTLNQGNLLWHGLHSPNDLPYRFSFLFSFVMLLIAYEALQQLEHLRTSQLLGSAVGIAAYLVIEERFGDTLGFEAVYVSLGLVLIYALISVLAARRKVARTAVCCLLLLTVSAEMVVNGCYTINRLNANEYFTQHSSYVDNVTTDAVKLMVNRTEQIGDKAANGAFYRMEFIPRRTCVDTSLFDYRGLTVFASSNSYEATRLMGSLGYAVNGVNSYLYHSFVPAADSLLGIRYVALENEIYGHKQLELIDSVTAYRTTEDGSEEQHTFYIYENKDALPLGYMVNNEVKDWDYSYYYPFSSLNTLYAAMTGNQSDVFENLPLDEDFLSPGGSVNWNSSFTYSPENAGDTGEFRITIEERGQYFAYVDCRSAENIRMELEGSAYSVTPHEPYIIDLGTLSQNTEIITYITADSTVSGNIYVCRFNEDVYNKNIAQMAVGGLQVTSFTDSSVNGTIHAEENGVMMVTLPYDEGWTVTVDGREAEVFPVGEGFMGVAVAAGDHTVEMTYWPKGLTEGIVISGVCLVLVVLLGLWQSGLFGKKKKTEELTLLYEGHEDEDAPVVVYTDEENPLSRVSLEELMAPNVASTEAATEMITAEEPATETAVPEKPVQPDDGWERSADSVDSVSTENNENP